VIEWKLITREALPTFLAIMAGVVLFVGLLETRRVWAPHLSSIAAYAMQDPPT
jgi:hypothetical protein